MSFCVWFSEAFQKGYSGLRQRLGFLPHVPTLIMSSIFWWFYQVYACGYLAFVAENVWLQILNGFLVCYGIGMTCASVYGTTLQRYPLIPKKFAISPDFDDLAGKEQHGQLQDIIQKTGANEVHIKKYCTTCKIACPERSHHCAVCNQCMPRFDHHCVALHKCIHNKNQKQFTLFFFWMCFSLLVAIISFHPYLMRTREEAIKYEEVKQMSWTMYVISIYTWFYSGYLGESYSINSFTIVFFAFNSIMTYFLLMIFSFVFINFMWFCNIRNGSVLACNKAMLLSKKPPFISFKDSKTRCFRKPTILKNIQVIFGEDWRFWLIPISSIESDGWLHSCECKSRDR
ncbi:hypothetical protein M3Y97_01164000 [Aphelenchoides bicaudatus]|nr:hypothetical protein M3Y97_01164000 [Aphelenchoides bicaudatus]